MSEALTEYLANLPGRCPNGFDIKTQHPRYCRCKATLPVAPPTSEWDVFVAAVKAAARDGLVHQRDVRPAIRGRVAPKSIGTFYRRAKSEGWLRDTGEREPSDDVVGRNADKLDRVYALVAT